MSDNTLISVKGVKKYYLDGAVKALDGVDLEIDRGEVVVIIGPSGSGKSTMLRSLNLLEIPTEGSIIFDGDDITDPKLNINEHRQKMGMVFQHFNLFPNMTVLRNLTIAPMKLLKMSKEDAEKKAESLLSAVGLADRADSYPSQLSGGQKQTIAFASVYALNPDIFVLDEPSSNLDPEAIQELRRLLLLIKSQGKTIVVSEHRLYFLNGIADRIVLMEHGKLKQSWSARDFDLLSTEQIKALGLRSYTPARLELPETMPSRNDTPAVEVKDLAIGYEKGKPVAQHLNFRVYPGEIVGVVGKNGCGKSTLARTLCGLQKELRGEVLYQNSMIPSKRRIRKAYLVMQDPDYQLFTDSVYQELLLALSDQKDKDEKRIDDILDELNLTIYKERHPMSLSGGQKQRTAIGVAALRDAEVLIFDEPTSGLDYKNMESVAGILSALSKRGKAILVISHDNELLMKICSRVIRMDEKTSS